MTSKLIPTTKLSFRQVFWRSMLRKSKDFQGNPRISQKIPRISKEILALSPKSSFFQHKLARQGNMDDSMLPKTGNGPTTWVPMPCGPKSAIPKPNTVFRANGSPWMLAAGPFGAPPAYKYKRMSLKDPPPWSFFIAIKRR